MSARGYDSHSQAPPAPGPARATASLFASTEPIAYCSLKIRPKSLENPRDHMNQKAVTLVTVIAFLAVAAACEKKAPTAPASTSAVSSDAVTVTDAKTGTTLTSPVPVSPADGQQIKFSDQPIKLVVNNAATTGT